MQITASPRVIKIGDTATITVRSPVLAADREYQVRSFSKVNRSLDTQEPARTDEQGALTLTRAFASAGEYLVDVLAEGQSEPLVSVALFAVPAEWHALRPFKGDTHMHTTNSDGKHSAVEMAQAARQRGMDFIAVTDHDAHGPSAEVLDEIAQQVPGLCVLQGEEVSVRVVGGHILSIGAQQGIGKRRYARECTEAIPVIQGEIGDRALVDPLTAEHYAHVLWVVREIQKAGGCAAMAHPYWVGTTRKYFGPRCVFEQLAADRLLDGMELMGGSPDTEQNLLALARYQAQLQQGYRLPVLGGSDAHHVDDVARLYTILFAASLSRETIIAAIRDGWTVACDCRMGKQPAVFGAFALVEYAYFLIREFFPRHDQLCADGNVDELSAWVQTFWPAS